MMNVIDKLQTARNLGYDLVHTVPFNETQKMIEILTERANLLDDLNASDEAREDRHAAEYIRKHPHENHSLRCCKRAEIDLVAIAERNGIRGFNPA